VDAVRELGIRRETIFRYILLDLYLAVSAQCVTHRYYDKYDTPTAR